MNFKVIRVKSRRETGVLDGIKDYLVPGQEFLDKDLMVSELKRLIELAPELCYFSLAFDPDAEDESKVVLYFIIAYVRPNSSVVVGLQFWSQDREKYQVIEDKMIELFTNWCELNEYTEIQAENLRNDEKMLVRFGFKPKLTLYSYPLNQPISLPEDVKKEETPNGSV